MVGAITVPKLSEYDAIEIYTRWGSFAVNTGRGIVSGIHCDWASGNPAQPITHHILGSISGDRLTITMCNYIVHSAGSGHSGNVENQLYISKIIGAEPSKSAILEKIGGGGVLNLAVSLYLRGAQYVETHLNTQGNWAAIQSTNKNRYTCKRIYRVSKQLQSVLGTFCRQETYRPDCYASIIHGRKCVHSRDVEYNLTASRNELFIRNHFWEYPDATRCGHKHQNPRNDRTIRRSLHRNWLLKTRGWNYV